MSDPRWADEIAELVAHILHGWFGACSCESSDDGDRKCATKLLAALADAGLLTPPDALLPVITPPIPDGPGEMWEEWGYRIRWPGGETVDHSEEDEGVWDEEAAREYMGYHVDDHSGTTGVLIRRIGCYGPWRPVDTPGEHHG